jgi:acetyl esterase/lipase
VAVNYRLTPENKSPAFLEDAAAAVAWTLKHIGGYGGSDQRVFVSGHSAGGYLTLMLGLDKKWLAAHDLDPKRLAGLVAVSPQVITHFAIREENGMKETHPLVDEFAPLYHVGKNAPTLLIITGDREREMTARYEENAYFARMMKLNGHEHTTLHELEGFDHVSMAEPAMALLLKFMEDTFKRSTKQ